MIHVRNSELAFGMLGRDGTLGFEAPMTRDRVMLPPRIAFAEALSAHAPSEVVVELAEPMSVRGALNASACLYDGGACEFWIDDHWIGDLSDPCATTPAIHLPAGNYCLSTGTTRHNWGAHSLWLFAPSPARHRRVALVTVACYPGNRIKDAAHWLHASAASVGWLLHAFGVDTPFENHYKSKVERCVAWIRSLPPCYEHVVFLDARDAFVCGTEDEVAARLEHPLSISMESVSWPERGERWVTEFRAFVAQHEESTPLTFINSGMYAGTREAVVRFLDRLIALRHRWLRGDGPDWLLPYCHFDDDQFLFHAGYRLDPSSARLDTRAELLCNMSWHHVELAHPDIDPGDRKVTTRYGTEPLFLHFAGTQTPNLPYWYHWLLGKS